MGVRESWLTTLSCVFLVACGKAPSDEPAFSPNDVSAPATLVAKGERLSHVLGCRGCHGKDLAGKEWIDEPQFAVLYSSNLTHSVRRFDNAEIETILRTGVSPGGEDLWEMPSEAFAPLSDADMQAVLAYLRTLKPTGQDWPSLKLGPEGREEIAAGKFKPTKQWVQEEKGKAPIDLGAKHARGRYLSQLACGECHTPTLDGKDEPFRPNLTVVSAYNRADFESLMRKGVALGGRELPLMSGVARGRFSKLTADEVDAIYAYLSARAGQP
jgi:cytochrome c553